MQGWTRSFSFDGQTTSESFTFSSSSTQWQGGIGNHQSTDDFSSFFSTMTGDFFSSFSDFGEQFQGFLDGMQQPRARRAPVPPAAAQRQHQPPPPPPRQPRHGQQQARPQQPQQQRAPAPPPRPAQPPPRPAPKPAQPLRTAADEMARARQRQAAQLERDNAKRKVDQQRQQQQQATAAGPSTSPLKRKGPAEPRTNSSSVKSGEGSALDPLILDDEDDVKPLIKRAKTDVGRKQVVVKREQDQKPRVKIEIDEKPRIKHEADVQKYRAH